MRIVVGKIDDTAAQRNNNAFKGGLKKKKKTRPCRLDSAELKRAKNHRTHQNEKRVRPAETPLH